MFPPKPLCKYGRFCEFVKIGSCRFSHPPCKQEVSIIINKKSHFKKNENLQKNNKKNFLQSEKIII